MNKQLTSVFTSDIPVVSVYRGDRGPAGAKGNAGDPGPAGTSINVRGAWQSGATYSPGDAVTYQNSLFPSVTSLYIQKSTSPTALSTTPPDQDPSRWSEIGITDLSAATGSIWIVNQVGHGFTRIGTPVAYVIDEFVPASATDLGNPALAVIRSVIDASNFILQSTGAIDDIDPLLDGGVTLDDDTLYYVSTLTGRLTDVAPTGGGAVVQPIIHTTIAPSGIVLPWAPADAAAVVPPSTSIEGVAWNIDQISSGFDGVETDFDLEIQGGVPVELTNSASAMIYIDGTRQQPNVDYILIEGPGGPTTTTIRFLDPPEAGWYFWGTIGIQVSP